MILCVSWFFSISLWCTPCLTYYPVFLCLTTLTHWPWALHHPRCIYKNSRSIATRAYNAFWTTLCIFARVCMHNLCILLMRVMRAAFSANSQLVAWRLERYHRRGVHQHSVRHWWTWSLAHRQHEAGRGWTQSDQGELQNTAWHYWRHPAVGFTTHGRRLISSFWYIDLGACLLVELIKLG